MNFNFTWLEDFLAVALTGNFSRAAEERNSSQPAFSRRIRALEEWIGAPLLDRSSQPARLTEVGEWFKAVAEELVERASRLPGEAKQVAEVSSGTLRIAATHALSFTFLPQWLRSIESSTTSGRFQLNSDVLARCEAQMEEGKVHFVLAHAHPKALGLLDSSPYESTKIGTDQLLPVSKSAAGQPIHALEIKKGAPNVPVLTYTEESGMGRVVRTILGRRLKAVAHQVVFSAHLASVLRSMALDGRGLAWLPKTLIQEDLDVGRLVIAAGPEWIIDVDIRLYRQRMLVGAAAAGFWSAAVDRGTKLRRSR